MHRFKVGSSLRFFHDYRLGTLVGNLADRIQYCPLVVLPARDVPDICGAYRHLSRHDHL